jgi:hypothetical protein
MLRAQLADGSWQALMQCPHEPQALGAANRLAVESGLPWPHMTGYWLDDEAEARAPHVFNDLVAELLSAGLIGLSPQPGIIHIDAQGAVVAVYDLGSEDALPAPAGMRAAVLRMDAAYSVLATKVASLALGARAHAREIQDETAADSTIPVESAAHNHTRVETLPQPMLVLVEPRHSAESHREQHPEPELLDNSDSLKDERIQQLEQALNAATRRLADIAVAWQAGHWPSLKQLLGPSAGVCFNLKQTVIEITETPQALGLRMVRNGHSVARSVVSDQNGEIALQITTDGLGDEDPMIVVFPERPVAQASYRSRPRATPPAPTQTPDDLDRPALPMPRG